MLENKKQTPEVDEAEESELEEKIEDEEEQEDLIDDNQFHEFIQPATETASPVLEKVETFEQESLEQEIGSIPIQTENKENDSVKYSQTGVESEGNEIKYQGNVEPPVLHPVNMQSSLPRQEFLHTPKEIDFSAQNNIRPEIINAGSREERHGLPFESDNKKYKEAKLERIE